MLSKVTLALALAITAITMSVPARRSRVTILIHQATRTALTAETAPSGNAVIMRSDEIEGRAAMVRPSSGREARWPTKYEIHGVGRAAQAGE